jgi:tRNA-2-methylthio-N6-dimethylallyladenosine synthase
MNHSDSERIAGFLSSQKFKETENINEADLVIFNTCGVRQMAEDRIYGQIHNLRIRNQKSGIKNQESRIKIILTGCLANRPDVQKRLKNKVDLFFPINEFEKFEKFVIEKFENLLKIVNCKLKIPAYPELTTRKNNTSYFSITPKYSDKFQAGVPIMTGCNNFCAYCVVPNARGREVSRPTEDIISEIKELVKNGTRHIILLGQNVNSYRGSDKNSSAEEEDKHTNFPQLLKKINAIPGKFWISFVSNHPKDVTDEMIEVVAKCKKVCENFHLPIQAGNDAVLRNMNRKYTAKEYLKIMRKIKSAFKKHKPAVPFSITSDIIVGFPGETKKQFEDSAEVMRKAKFDMVFFGKFSPRPETAAWKMKDNVSKMEKERRANYLNEILKKTCFENNKKYVGKTLEVLIENKKDENYFGKTRTMKNVKIVPNFHSDKTSESKNLIGKIIKVKITKANIWNLEAIIK